jgi:hypothetical protein
MTTNITVGGSHAVIRLDRMSSSYHGNLESVQHTADLDNGSVVNIGNLVAGERELLAVAVPATASLGTAEVLLVANPELTYYVGQTMQDYYIPANTPARAYHLHAGDEWTVSSAAIDGGAAVAIGSYVVAQNGSTRLLAQVAQPVAGANRFVGEIVESNYLGAYQVPCVTIRVLQA